MTLSADEFTAALLDATSTEELVRNVVFAGLPHVFGETPDTWTELRSRVAGDLNCDEGNILVVGSAKMGYSLAPRKYGRPFNDHSDIDVIVICDALFDEIWLSVLRWHYRRRYRLPPADRAWDSSRRNDLYWGYLNPTGFQYKGLSRPRQLQPAKRISVMWFNAFQALGRVPALAGRRVSGRLYRSLDHAISYHDHGLRELRAALIAGNV
jgi:hypothetical protein